MIRFSIADRLIIGFDAILRNAGPILDAVPSETRAASSLPTPAPLPEKGPDPSPHHGNGAYESPPLGLGSYTDNGVSYPAGRLGPDQLSSTEQRQVAGLMRVNHAGEVAAQALYAGQSLWARDETVKRTLEQAGREEADHLAWCTERLAEVGAKPSRLQPLWYAGSFVIGSLVAARGDQRSLGFVAETERQVVAHLEGHSRRLPSHDHRSRAVVAQMAADEKRHGEGAIAAGGTPVGPLGKWVMRLSAKVMTTSAYWF